MMFRDEPRLTPRDRPGLSAPSRPAARPAHQKGIAHDDLKPANA
jgi:hypothetical protein